MVRRRFQADTLSMEYLDDKNYRKCSNAYGSKNPGVSVEFFSKHRSKAGEKSDIQHALNPIDLTTSSTTRKDNPNQSDYRRQPSGQMNIVFEPLLHKLLLRGPS